MPGQRDEEWMRTDIRLFGSTSSAFQPRPRRRPARRLPAGLLTQGVELAGQVSALDSQPHAATLAEKWAKRGVLFGSLDELVARAWRLIRPHLFARSIPSLRQVRGPARGGLERRHAALCAARRGGRSSRCTCSRRCRRGPPISGTRWSCSKTVPRRRCWPKPPACTRAPAACTGRGRIDRRPQRRAALRQPAELGHRRVALRPSKGARRSRRRVAMDDRRAGQPAGQGQSARGLVGAGAMPRSTA